jgi:SEC-C motif-containing protein
MAMSFCYCGNNAPFEICCKPYIDGNKKATTAETLMRSRYAAYATLAIDYLIATTHSSQRKYYSKSDIRTWAVSNQWLKLEVIAATPTTVEFKAHFLDANKTVQIHHEKSTFVFEEDHWFYVDGLFNENIV